MFTKGNWVFINLKEDDPIVSYISDFTDRHMGEQITMELLGEFYSEIPHDVVITYFHNFYSVFGVAQKVGG